MFYEHGDTDGGLIDDVVYAFDVVWENNKEYIYLFHDKNYSTMSRRRIYQDKHHKGWFKFNGTWYGELGVIGGA